MACSLLAYPILTQRRRGEIGSGGGEAEVVGLLFLVLHAQRQVTSRLQVIEHLQGGPGHLLVVVVLRVRFGHAPQLSTAIVMIDHGRLPGPD